MAAAGTPWRWESVATVSPGATEISVPPSAVQFATVSRPAPGGFLDAWYVGVAGGGTAWPFELNGCASTRPMGAACGGAGFENVVSLNRVASLLQPATP